VCTEYSKYDLDSYFSMTDMTLEPSSEPDYAPSVEVVLPSMSKRLMVRC
jgi:hypothetical protein